MENCVSEKEIFELGLTDMKEPGTDLCQSEPDTEQILPVPEMGKDSALPLLMGPCVLLLRPLTCLSSLTPHSNLRVVSNSKNSP